MTAEPPSPSLPSVDVVVEPAWSDAGLDLPALVDRAVAAVVARVRLPGHGAAVELAVRFTDDATIAELNTAWRGKEGATDVLSFPATEPGDTGVGPAIFGPVLLGDVVLAYETCAGDARDLDRLLADHVTHLVVHGVLHLAHHDHRTGAEARRMETLEVAILATLGIADPYLDHPLLEETR